MGTSAIAPALICALAIFMPLRDDDPVRGEKVDLEAAREFVESLAKVKRFPGRWHFLTIEAESVDQNGMRNIVVRENVKKARKYEIRAPRAELLFDEKSRTVLLHILDATIVNGPLTIRFEDKVMEYPLFPSAK